MAPIVPILTHTMSTSLTTNPVRKTNGSEYTTIVVGHGSSAMTVQILVAPSIHAFIPDKAMAFDFLFAQLRPFHPAIHVVDLTTALSNHFDVNHSVARSETATVIARLQAALFQCPNLTGLRFLDQDGNPAGAVVEDPADRPDGLAFFVFDTTVIASDIDSRLSAIEPFTIRFALPLPQHVLRRGRWGTHPAHLPLWLHCHRNPPSPLFSEARLEAAVAGSVAPEGEVAVDADARLLALQVELRSIMRQAPSPRRLFQSEGDDTPCLFLSPKMARLLAVAPTLGRSPPTWGVCTFWTTRVCLTQCFPPLCPWRRTACLVTALAAHPSATASRTSWGAASLSCSPTFSGLDYVGSDSVTGPETIRQISDRLSRLSIVYQSRGQTHTCRVDDLFKKYLSEVPVLPDDTRLWGFTLTNYFWSALPEEMQSRITENKTVQTPGHVYSCHKDHPVQ